MKNKSCLAYFQGHKGSALCVSISPDNKEIASGGEDGTLRFWDFENGTLLQEWKNHKEPILSLSFHPVEKQIAIGTQKGISVYNRKNAEKLYSIDYPFWANTIAFDSTGNNLVYGGYDNTIFLWNAREKKQIAFLSGHEQEITCLTFSPDDKILVSGCNDHKIKVWDIPTCKCIRTLEGHTLGISGICFSKEGKKIVSSSFDGSLRTWNIETGEIVSRLQVNSNCLTDCAFLNETTIASSSGIMGISPGENAIVLWDEKYTRCLEKYYTHDYAITKIQISSDKKKMVSCDLGGKIAFWDFSSFQEQEKREEELPCVLTIDDDEWIQRLIKATLKKECQIISAFNGKEGFLLAQKEKPDLILLDIMMPEMDGWELLKKLRSTPEFMLTPIIFLTAMDSPEDRVKALKSGVSDYMAKPFNGQELLARVHNLITLKRQIEKNREQKNLLPLSHKSILSGNLEQIRFFSVLQLLEAEKHTGMLYCIEERATVQIFFKNGFMLIPKAQAQANQMKEDISYFLQKAKGIFDFWITGLDEEEKILVSVKDLLTDLKKLIRNK